MRNMLCSALVALVLAVPLFAQLSEPYQNWAEGPVKWLLTDEELYEWNRIDTDEEAKAFLDLFWARRDPTPGTPANEWKTAFEGRVEVADEKFRDARIRGSLSDRGRTFILLGSPFRRSVEQVSPTGERPGPGAFDSPLDPNLSNTTVEIWHYEKDTRPEFAKGADFDIEFIDNRGRGEFRLSTTGRRDPRTLFEQARQYYLFQPDRTAAPDFTSAAAPTVDSIQVEEVSREFESQYLKAAYEEFKAAAEPDDDDLHLTYGEFMTPGGRYFVPVQLYVPASAGIDTSGELTFFGVVEKEGEIVAVYEEPVTLVASNNDAFYDKSLMLQPGSYVGTFGLARDNEPIALARTDLVLGNVALDEPSVSRLILSNNVYPLTEAQDFTDPYAFGGLKIVPKGDDRFDTSDEIWYFVELRHLGLNAGGQPTVRIKLDVEGNKADGTPVKMGAPMMEADVEPVKDTEGHYMFGGSFPAGSFPAGSYTFKARVFDANTKLTWNLEQSFTVTE